MMRQTNRTRYDIYAEVLQVLRFYDTAGISVIGRRANLPLDRAKEITQFMIARGLIVKLKNPEKRPVWVYRATSQGSEYLNLYKKLSLLVTEITPEEIDMWADD